MCAPLDAVCCISHCQIRRSFAPCTPTHSSPRTPLLRCLCRMPLLLTRQLSTVACGVRPHRCTVNMRSPSLLQTACSTSSSSTLSSVTPSRIPSRSRTFFRTHPSFWSSRRSGPTLHCSVHLLLTTFGAGSCANQELMLGACTSQGKGKLPISPHATTRPLILMIAVIVAPTP